MQRQIYTGLFSLLSFTLSMHAGNITGAGATVGGGTSISGAGTVSPNNDNHVSGSPNAITISATLIDAQPVDFVFNVINSGGTTEYLASIGVVNGSPSELRGLEFALGFATAGSFRASAALDGLDFDWPSLDPLPTSSRFPSITHLEDQLRFFGGSMPGSFSDALSLSIDVADFNPDSIPIAARTATGFQITLRLVPTIANNGEPTNVPEAAGIGVLALLNLFCLKGVRLLTRKRGT